MKDQDLTIWPFWNCNIRLFHQFWSHLICFFTLFFVVLPQTGGPFRCRAGYDRSRVMSGRSNGTLVHQAMPKGHGSGKRNAVCVGIWPQYSMIGVISCYINMLRKLVQRCLKPSYKWAKQPTSHTLSTVNLGEMLDRITIWQERMRYDGPWSQGPRWWSWSSWSWLGHWCFMVISLGTLADSWFNGDYDIQYWKILILWTIKKGSTELGLKTRMVYYVL